MSQRGDSLVVGFEFIWKFRDITWIFLLVRFSVVLECVAIIISFDLHSSFKTFVCFLYQVKDSDKRFVRSEIILLLRFTKFASFSYYHKLSLFEVPSTITDGRQYFLKLEKQSDLTGLQFVLWWGIWWRIWWWEFGKWNIIYHIIY